MNSILIDVGFKRMFSFLHETVLITIGGSDDDCTWKTFEYLNFDHLLCMAVSGKRIDLDLTIGIELQSLHFSVSSCAI